MYLNPKEFSDHKESRILAVNDLSDERLFAEIQKGPKSRQFSDIIFILEEAKLKRDNASNANERKRDIELSVESNAIAKGALEEAKKANIKANQARIWSAFAIFVSVVLAFFDYFFGAG